MGNRYESGEENRKQLITWTSKEINLDDATLLHCAAQLHCLCSAPSSARGGDAELTADHRSWRRRTRCEGGWPRKPRSWARRKGFQSSAFSGEPRYSAPTAGPEHGGRSGSRAAAGRRAWACGRGDGHGEATHATASTSAVGSRSRRASIVRRGARPDQKMRHKKERQTMSDRR